MLQGLVSVRRIAKYLAQQEVAPVSPLHEQESRIALRNATISWPKERTGSVSVSGMGSTVATPKHKFVLVDLNMEFPEGELSLVCGKLGTLVLSVASPRG